MEYVRAGSHGDAVHDEAALGVVKKAEVLVRLVDGDHVLETAGVAHVGADPVGSEMSERVRANPRCGSRVPHRHGMRSLPRLSAPALAFPPPRPGYGALTCCQP